MILDAIHPDLRFPADALWQSTAILTAALAAARASRSRPARAHAILTAGAAAAVAAPVGSAVARHFGLGFVAPAPITTAAPADTAQWAAAHAVTGGTSPVELAASMLLVAWLAITSVMLLRLAASAVRTIRLVRAASPIDAVTSRRLVRLAGFANMRELPAIRIHPGIAGGAAVAGPRGGVLLLSPDALALDDHALLGILAHEAAHLRRRDHLHAAATTLLVAALPWQPLAWRVRARAATQREFACDDWAVRASGSPLAYARMLCTLAGPRPRDLAFPMAAGDVGRRVRRLIAAPDAAGVADSEPTAGHRFGLSLSITAGAIALLAAGMQVRARAATDLTIDVASTPATSTSDAASRSPAIDSATAAASHPIRVSRRTLDLGMAQAGDAVAGPLSIANAGDTPIVVREIPPTCGCTTIEGFEGPVTLAPGASLTVTVVMTVPDEPGTTKSKRLRIVADDLEPVSIDVVSHASAIAEETSILAAR